MKGKKLKINGNISVLFMKQDGYFICYTPVLDLSTCGKTYEEAESNFEEVLNIFFEETLEAGTLEDILLEMGWQQFKTELRPPEIISTESHSIPSFNIPALA